MENENFGELVHYRRKKKGWTIKEFIEKLVVLGGKASPTYITKIEVYGEIPSPETICKIAEILDCDENKLLKIAKAKKIERFEKTLEQKYQSAVGLYKLEKGRKGESKS